MTIILPFIDNFREFYMQFLKTPLSIAAVLTLSKKAIFPLVLQEIQSGISRIATILNEILR